MYIVQGVEFILYSAAGTAAPENCLTESLPPSPSSSESEHTSGLTALCHVNSGEDGAFRFRLLPNGRYAVVPHYVGRNIRFDVLPPVLGFEVNHAHNVIEQVFKVEGFTVQG